MTKKLVNLTSILLMSSALGSSVIIPITGVAQQVQAKSEKFSVGTKTTGLKDQPTLKQNSKFGPGYYDGTQTFEPMARDYVQDFFKAIKPGAIKGWKKYHVLPSIAAAQALIESGWGRSALATKGNNLFGIKGSYKGQSINFPTQEWENDHYVTVNAAFRKYPSWSASIEDHGRFLAKNSRYHNLLGVRDYHVVAQDLHSDGYATDPNYASSLIHAVETYSLQKWDKKAFSDSSNPTPKPGGSGSATNVSGSFTFTTTTNIRTAPSTSAKIVGSYNPGETVHYIGKVNADGYTWLKYIGASGATRYVAVVH